MINVTMRIQRVINVSTTKNPDISNAFVLVEGTFRDVTTNSTIGIFCDSKLGLSPGQTDILVTGTVRVRRGRLAIFVTSIAKRK
jgi:hypothetical protein